MIPLVAILSTSETVRLRASFAAVTSLASSDARMALRAVRSRDRIVRLCSRRRMFCRFAFSADLVRLATFWRPLLYNSLVCGGFSLRDRNTTLGPNQASEARTTEHKRIQRLDRENSRAYKAPIVPRPLRTARPRRDSPAGGRLLGLQNVHGQLPLAVSLPHPDADVEAAFR